MDMFTEVDWSKRGEYMTTKHGITPTEANEALNDPMRFVLDPDPASETGDTSASSGGRRMLKPF